MESLTIASCLSAGSAEREAYNALATNLLLLRSEGGAITVTAPKSNEGKSAATLGLALALANAGRSVLVVDGDLRTGALSALCGAADAPGLSAVLRGELSPEAALLASESPSLSVLAAGELLADPTSLLSGEALSELLRAFGERADFVLIDAPAILPTADGSIIAAASDSSVLYVAKNSVSRRDLSAAREQLDKSGRPAIGVIFSEAPVKKRPFAFLSRLPIFGKKSRNNKG